MVIRSESDGPLQVLIVAAEASPYATIGGFSRVVEALSRALIKQGHDVRVLIPKFGFLDESKYKTETVLQGLKVPTGDESNPELICNVKKHRIDAESPIVYFLENLEYYEKRANVYGYSDDPTRWLLLSRGALEFVRNIKKSSDSETKKFCPQVIHVNDWHTGILPNLLKTEYSEDPILKEIATLFTIHNMRFQGMFDPRNISELDFDDGKSDIAPMFSPLLEKQNFLKRGIIYADIVNTVSPTYAKEILLPEYGEGLDRLLMEVKNKLFGVLNGLDYDLFDPATDEVIEKQYDINSLDKRVENKLALQKEFGITVSPDIPLFGFVGRLDYQKGIDLVIEGMRYLIREFDAAFVQVGGGDPETVGEFKKLKEEFPDNVGIHPLPNFTLPRLLFAGCDALLYPSRFEPCGIVQLEAMRYGSVPIVRKVGGLADSVENYDPKTGRGTGFVFDNFNIISFYGQLVRAVETYRHKSLWRGIQKNAMRQDFSWTSSAQKYMRLYGRAIQFHSNNVNLSDYEYSLGISL